MLTSNLLTGEQLISQKSKADKELPHIGEKDFSPSNSWSEKTQIQNSLSERKSLLEQQRIEKRNNLACATWISDAAKAKVTKKVGKHWESLGHHSDGCDWLYPEEALILLETNCLELIFDQIPLSIERAYVILINGKNGCTTNEYRVYSHLVRNGYRLFRHSSSVSVTRYEKQIHLDQHVLKDKEIYMPDCHSNSVIVEESIVVNNDASASSSSNLDLQSSSLSFDKNVESSSACNVNGSVCELETHVDVVSLDVDESAVPSDSTIETCPVPSQTVTKNIISIDLGDDEDDEDDEDSSDDDVVEVPIQKKQIIYAEISSNESESSDEDEEEDDDDDDDDDDESSQDSGGNWKRKSQHINVVDDSDVSQASANRTNQTTQRSRPLFVRTSYPIIDEFLFETSADKNCEVIDLSNDEDKNTAILNKEVNRFYKEIEVIDLDSDPEETSVNTPQKAGNTNKTRAEIFNSIIKIEDGWSSMESPNQCLPCGIKPQCEENIKLNVNLDVVTSVHYDPDAENEVKKSCRYRHPFHSNQQRNRQRNSMNPWMSVNPVNLQQQQNMQTLMNSNNHPAMQQLNFLANNMMQLFSSLTGQQVPSVGQPFFSHQNQNQNQMFRANALCSPMTTTTPFSQIRHLQNRFPRPNNPNQIFNPVGYRSEFQGYFMNNGNQSSSYQRNNYTFHQNMNCNIRPNVALEWQQNANHSAQNSPQLMQNKRQITHEIDVDIGNNRSQFDVSSQNINHAEVDSDRERQNHVEVVDLDNSKSDEFISVNSSPDCSTQDRSFTRNQNKNDRNRGFNRRGSFPKRWCSNQRPNFRPKRPFSEFESTDNSERHSANRFFDDDHMDGSRRAGSASPALIFDKEGGDPAVFVDDIPLTDSPTKKTRMGSNFIPLHNRQTNHQNKRKACSFQGRGNKRRRFNKETGQIKLEKCQTTSGPKKRLKKKKQGRYFMNRNLPHFNEKEGTQHVKCENTDENSHNSLQQSLETSRNDDEIILIDEPEDVKTIIKLESTESSNVNVKTLAEESEPSSAVVCKIEPPVKNEPVDEKPSLESIENQAIKTELVMDSSISIKTEVLPVEIEVLPVKSEPGSSNESRQVDIGRKETEPNTSVIPSDLSVETEDNSAVLQKSSTETDKNKEVTSWAQLKESVPCVASPSPSTPDGTTSDVESKISEDLDEIQPILAPKDCQSLSTLLSALQVFEPANLSAQNLERLKITFDVYMPSPSFKKSSRGLPNYRLVVVSYMDPFPSANQMAELSGRFEDCVPILIAVVLPDSISFINCGLVTLPILDEID